MAYGKIKGKAWCTSCAQTQPAVLTTLVQIENHREVQGYCQVCKGFVSRVYGIRKKEEACTINEADSIEDKVVSLFEENKETESDAPVQVKKARHLPTLLRVLGVSILMLFVDRFMI